MQAFKMSQNQPTLSDEEKRSMAEQYLAGDKSVLQNLGRGVQGSSNLVALRGEIAKQAAEQKEKFVETVPLSSLSGENRKIVDEYKKKLQQ